MLLKIADTVLILINACVHVKLEIRLFVMNFNSRGFSLRILYCVVDTGYGLAGSLWACRPALLKGQKYQMVKTQIESHDRRPSPDLKGCIQP